LDRITLKSYAKINIGLNIIKKREDGYHQIVTLLQQIDLHDEITFEKSGKEITITITDSDVPAGPDNLILRAFDLVRERFKIDEGLRVHLKKTIPVGSGLGGGSSNAAATLVAANIMWKLNLSITELENIAATIGSDVPFFIRGGTMLATGRGEILTPVKIEKDWLALVVSPQIHISTKWAYSRSKIALTKDENFTKFKLLFKRFDPQYLRFNIKNDFEEVVFKRHPLLLTIKEKLYEKGAFYASLSGSGSSVYGLFNQSDKAEEAVEFFSIEQRMKSFLCRPM